MILQRVLGEKKKNEKLFLILPNPVIPINIEPSLNNI